MCKSTGCKGSYSFMKTQFHNRTTQVFPDAMHTVKDTIEHLFNLITGKEDSPMVRKVEVELNRFGLQVQNTTRKRIGEMAKKLNLPSAPFRLSPEEIETANSRVCSVSLPSLDFTPGAIFTRTFGLKSHDWKEVLNNYTLVCVCVVRGGGNQTRWWCRETIIGFLHYYNSFGTAYCYQVLRYICMVNVIVHILYIT